MASQALSPESHLASHTNDLKSLEDLIPRRFFDNDKSDQEPAGNCTTKVIKATLAYLGTEIPALLELSSIIPERYFEIVPRQEVREELAEKVLRAAYAYLVDIAVTISKTAGHSVDAAEGQKA